KTAAKEIFKKYPIFKNRKIIFNPSRLGLAKGCDVSLKALRIIKKVFPDVLLIFTGTKNIIEWGTKQQKDIAYILHLAKKLGLEKNIFMQTIPFDLMPKFYRIADVCVYPSASQKPFGMSILESLASSVPVVVTESGGIEEVIKDGKNGFVVKIRNYKELADRCILILKNRKICDELGGNGRVLVEKKFTKEIMAENTIKVYNKILA
ncbi:MAG: glycosyltransferase family 4 protein, partial [Candidatus Atribacteria bacterium]|nr:glycosyltransferase family 4 protein [Candidatus Atribacteria bacterium]